MLKTVRTPVAPRNSSLCSVESRFVVDEKGHQ